MLRLGKVRRPNNITKQIQVRPIKSLADMIKNLEKMDQISKENGKMESSSTTYSENTMSHTKTQENNQEINEESQSRKDNRSEYSKSKQNQGRKLNTSYQATQSMNKMNHSSQFKIPKNDTFISQEIDKYLLQPPNDSKKVITNVSSRLNDSSTTNTINKTQPHPLAETSQIEKINTSNDSDSSPILSPHDVISNYIKTHEPNTMKSIHTKDDEGDNKMNIESISTNSLDTSKTQSSSHLSDDVKNGDNHNSTDNPQTMETLSPQQPSYTLTNVFSSMFTKVVTSIKNIFTPPPSTSSSSSDTTTIPTTGEQIHEMKTGMTESITPMSSSPSTETTIKISEPASETAQFTANNQSVNTLIAPATTATGTDSSIKSSVVVATPVEATSIIANDIQKAYSMNTTDMNTSVTATANRSSQDSSQVETNVAIHSSSSGANSKLNTEKSSQSNKIDKKVKPDKYGDMAAKKISSEQEVTKKTGDEVRTSSHVIDSVNNSNIHANQASVQKDLQHRNVIISDDKKTRKYIKRSNQVNQVNNTESKSSMESPAINSESIVSTTTTTTTASTTTAAAVKGTTPMNDSVSNLDTSISMADMTPETTPTIPIISSNTSTTPKLSVPIATTTTAADSTTITIPNQSSKTKQKRKNTTSHISFNTDISYIRRTNSTSEIKAPSLVSDLVKKYKIKVPTPSPSITPTSSSTTTESTAVTAINNNATTTSDNTTTTTSSLKNVLQDDVGSKKKKKRKLKKQLSIDAIMDIMNKRLDEKLGMTRHPPQELEKGDVVIEKDMTAITATNTTTAVNTEVSKSMEETTVKPIEIQEIAVVETISTSSQSSDVMISENITDKPSMVMDTTSPTTISISATSLSQSTSQVESMAENVAISANTTPTKLTGSQSDSSQETDIEKLKSSLNELKQSLDEEDVIELSTKNAWLHDTASTTATTTTTASTPPPPTTTTTTTTAINNLVDNAKVEWKSKMYKEVEVSINKVKNVGTLGLDLDSLDIPDMTTTANTNLNVTTTNVVTESLSSISSVIVPEDNHSQSHSTSVEVSSAVVTASNSSSSNTGDIVMKVSVESVPSSVSTSGQLYISTIKEANYDSLDCDSAIVAQSEISNSRNTKGEEDDMTYIQAMNEKLIQQYTQDSSTQMNDTEKILSPVGTDKQQIGAINTEVTAAATTTTNARESELEKNRTSVTKLIFESGEKERDHTPLPLPSQQVILFSLKDVLRGNMRDVPANARRNYQFGYAQFSTSTNSSSSSASATAAQMHTKNTNNSNDSEVDNINNFSFLKNAHVYVPPTTSTSSSSSYEEINGRQPRSSRLKLTELLKRLPKPTPLDLSEFGPSKGRQRFSFDTSTMKSDSTAAAESMSPIGASIRESMKKIQENRNQLKKDGPIMFKSGLSQEEVDEIYYDKLKVKNEILQGVKSSYRTSSNNNNGNRTTNSTQSDDLDDPEDFETVKIGGLGDVTIPVEEITDGEMRYTQKQVHLLHKKAEFQSKLPPETPLSKAAAIQEAKARLVNTSLSTNTVDDTGTISSINMPIPGLEPRSWNSSRRPPSSSSSSSSLQSSYNMNTNQQQQQQQYTRSYNVAEHLLPPKPVNISGQQLTVAEMKAQMEIHLQRQKLLQEEKLKTFSTDNTNRYRSAYAAQQEERKKMKKHKKLNKMNSITVVKEITLPAEGLSMKDLASKLSIKMTDLKRRLEDIGETISADHMNEIEKKLDSDIIELLVLEMGIEVKRLDAVNDDSMKNAAQGSSTLTADVPLEPRAPVVCIMGHVDHGKTTLLDYLRKANVAAGEAGGITQKLSAFTVELQGTRKVVFLDTPGHAAFSSMRVNGASATDVAVLVVAMDDGVRPQTIEAIEAARAGDCSIIVALNKVDKIPVADRSAMRAKVLGQLADLNVLAEEYGGDVLIQEISGRTGEGVDQLLESLALQTDVLELKAPTSGFAEATVLESCLEKGRGVVVNALVTWGSLSVGDAVVVGNTYGKIKTLILENNISVKSVGPSTPVKITGFKTVPSSGQELISVSTEIKAKELAERRQRVADLRQANSMKKTTTTTNDSVTTTTTNDTTDMTIDGKTLAKLNVYLKADGPGTLNALQKVIGAIVGCSEEVEVTLVSSTVGDISLSDIDRIGSIKGAESCLLGFNVNFADNNARAAAKEIGVHVMRNTIIYRLEDELKALMESLLPKERRLNKVGHAVVKQIFTMAGKNQSVVAGLSVDEGVLRVDSNKMKYYYHIIRNGQRITDSELRASNLKRFKDDVTEVPQGTECGLVLDNFTTYEVEDIIECYEEEFVLRKLILNNFGSEAVGEKNKKNVKDGEDGNDNDDGTTTNGSNKVTASKKKGDKKKEKKSRKK